MRAVLTAMVLVAEILAACSGTASRGTAAVGPPASPELRGGSLRDALALGAKTRRNVLVEYWDESCSWCLRMEREALSDPRVKEALAGVVFVRMTKGRDAESFFSRFGDCATPTHVVMKPDGRVLGNVVSGLVTAAEFATLVSWARTGEGTPPNIAGTGG